MVMPYDFSVWTPSRTGTHGLDFYGLPKGSQVRMDGGNNWMGDRPAIPRAAHPGVTLFGYPARKATNIPQN